MKRNLEKAYEMYYKKYEKRIAHRKNKDRLYYEQKLTMTEFANNVFAPNSELSNTEASDAAINFNIRGKNTSKQVKRRQEFLSDYDIKVTQGEIGAMSAKEFGKTYDESIDKYIQEQRKLGKQGMELRELISDYIYGS